MFKTSPLIVEAVYRLQSASPAPIESVFASLSLRIPPHACLVAPCPNVLAKILNQEFIQAFDRLDTSALVKQDPTELWDLLVNAKATIVAGQFTKGKVRFPGGFETIFELSAVYRLQE